jgi:hypothetical protein
MARIRGVIRQTAGKSAGFPYLGGGFRAIFRAALNPVKARNVHHKPMPNGTASEIKSVPGRSGSNDSNQRTPLVKSWTAKMRRHAEITAIINAARTGRRYWMPDKRPKSRRVPSHHHQSRIGTRIVSSGRTSLRATTAATIWNGRDNETAGPLMARRRIDGVWSGHTGPLQSLQD